ncbi:hypothetical protein [Ancylobacter terrae]|uniref:hypothetical protein n=1 Tax=Ancylobacter sp. sgz301288 TaxID=3342077 RepID=UPI00385F5075
MPRLAGLAVLILAALAPAAFACPLEKAVYTPLDADDDWGAEAGVANAWEITHVHPAPADADRPWIIRLAENRQKLAADFAVADPPGFSAVHVYMLVPPGGARKGFDAAKAPSASLYYFGDNLKRVDPRPDDGAPAAPPLMQLPGLSKAFWDWKRDGRRFVPPDGLWKVTACRD